MSEDERDEVQGMADQVRPTVREHPAVLAASALAGGAAAGALVLLLLAATPLGRVLYSPITFVVVGLPVAVYLFSRQRALSGRRRQWYQGLAAALAGEQVTVERYTVRAAVAVEEPHTARAVPAAVDEVAYDPEGCYTYFLDLGDSRALYVSDWMVQGDDVAPFPSTLVELVRIPGLSELVTHVPRTNAAAVDGYHSDLLAVRGLGEPLLISRCRTPLTAQEYHPADGEVLPLALSTLEADLRARRTAGRPVVA